MEANDMVWRYRSQHRQQALEQGKSISWFLWTTHNPGIRTVHCSEKFLHWSLNMSLLATFSKTACAGLLCSEDFLLSSKRTFRSASWSDSGSHFLFTLRGSFGKLFWWPKQNLICIRYAVIWLQQWPYVENHCFNLAIVKPYDITHIFYVCHEDRDNPPLRSTVITVLVYILCNM